MKGSGQKTLKRWCIIGVFVVMGLATLWHFVYEWLPCDFMAVISPVNESPWEHVKLYLIPPLIWYIVMYFAVGRYYPNFVFATAVSLVAMPVCMLALYGFYSQFVEKTLPLDIVNSLVTIALGMAVTYKLALSQRRLHGPFFRFASVLIVVGLTVTYGLLTYNPPLYWLFFDTQTKSYGIPQNNRKERAFHDKECFFYLHRCEYSVKPMEMSC